MAQDGTNTGFFFLICMKHRMDITTFEFCFISATVFYWID